MLILSPLFFLLKAKHAHLFQPFLTELGFQKHYHLSISSETIPTSACLFYSMISRTGHSNLNCGPFIAEYNTSTTFFDLDTIPLLMQLTRPLAASLFILVYLAIHWKGESLQL
uniref:Uncharacterized protein n=1 Tax=Micrurus surinamensis TaxID=129470 RepID=A0A2D4Q388_MICSU